MAEAEHRKRDDAARYYTGQDISIGCGCTVVVVKDPWT